MADLFNEDNTHWEHDRDGNQFLVYEGSLEELAKENNLTEDKVYDLFCEYEADSLDLIEELRDIEAARRGNY